MDSFGITCEKQHPSNDHHFPAHKYKYKFFKPFSFSMTTLYYQLDTSLENNLSLFSLVTIKTSSRLVVIGDFSSLSQQRLRSKH